MFSAWALCKFLQGRLKTQPFTVKIEYDIVECKCRITSSSVILTFLIGHLVWDKKWSILDTSISVLCVCVCIFQREHIQRSRTLILMKVQIVWHSVAVSTTALPTAMRGTSALVRLFHYAQFWENLESFCAAFSSFHLPLPLPFPFLLHLPLPLQCPFLLHLPLPLLFPLHSTSS